MAYLISDIKMQEYIKYAKDNGYKYILILKDLEDKDIFPAYFIDIKEREHYRSCLISESKIQELQIIECNENI